MIIWFAGLPDAGKTTTINKLAGLLEERGISFVVYDGVPFEGAEYEVVIAASINDLQIDDAIVVYVNTPAAICATRNTKGAYDRGVPICYVPSDPDITLCTVCATAEENARKVLEYYESAWI